MLVIFSNRTNVYENLAAEDVLLDDAGQTEPVVFVYRNTDSVVIGKNQNPWRECAVNRLDSLGVKLARRVSGGGTVYHDSGNINVSCILPRSHYHRDDVLHTYMDGLARAGVKAELTGGTSLAVEGKKISGNAFCYRRDKVLHHGTVLWKSDLVKLRAALAPEFPDISTRAVASVPMPVINLADVLPASSIEEVTNSIVMALADKWGKIVQSTYNPFDHDSFVQRLHSMQTWEWKFGATPDFECAINGSVLRVHRGIITEVFGDADTQLAGQMFQSATLP